MLAILTKIVNRKVEELYHLSGQGCKPLAPEYDDDLNQTVELVCKLAREERQTVNPFVNMTDEELLALRDHNQETK